MADDGNEEHGYKNRYQDLRSGGGGQEERPSPKRRRWNNDSGQLLQNLEGDGAGPAEDIVAMRRTQSRLAGSSFSVCAIAADCTEIQNLLNTVLYG